MVDIKDIQNDLAATKEEIRRLQTETLFTIAIKPTGKIEIVDKEELESLNSDILRLKDLSTHNRGVLDRLDEVLSKVSLQSITALEKAIRTSDEKITSCTVGINRVQGDFLRGNPYQFTAETIKTHPKVAKEIAAREQTIAAETEKLKALRPALDEAVAISAEFKPSGLQPMPASTAPAMISREKVAGMI